MVSEIHANGSRERTQRTMALDQSALLEVLDALKAAEVDDRIRQAAETIYQALIEAELASVTSALPHERTSTRTGQRNGHRPRCWPAPLVTWSCGSQAALGVFPSLLERRRRVDQSLFAVIMEAYLHGTSTRKVDDLVKALGAGSGISKSEVSRICAGLDTEGGGVRRPQPGRAAVPVCVPGRHLRQGARRSPGRLPGRRGRHRRGRRRAPRGPRL